MRYDAVTLDTNIFVQNGYHLESGMLAQLGQFKEGSAELVISEIVLREVIKHLKFKSKEISDSVGGLIKEIRKNRLMSSELEAQLVDIQNSLNDSNPALKMRLSEFMDKTGLSILPADKTDVKLLLKRYFDAQPPFDAVGKKKHEFPDAIALISLEAWARENDKKILAISNDSGWASYAAESEWIDVETDLASALQALQEDSDQAKKILTKILESIASGDLPSIREEIDGGISSNLEHVDVTVSVSTSYEYDVEAVDLYYRDFEFIKIGKDIDFNIVQIGKRKIVAKIPLFIMAQARAEVSFYAWDSIDKDRLPLGENVAERDIEFGGGLLISLVGDFLNIGQNYKIDSIELVDLDPRVDFGGLEPDYQGHWDDAGDLGLLIFPDEVN